MRLFAEAVMPHFR